jgi:hypothetical protein
MPRTRTRPERAPVSPGNLNLRNPPFPLEAARPRVANAVTVFILVLAAILGATLLGFFLLTPGY